MIKRYAIDAVILSTVVFLVLAAACAGSGGETTIIEENGITLDNLVVSDTVMLQDDVKIYFDTAKTTGLQYRPDIDTLELLSTNPYLSAPGRLFIQGNTGEDGGGSWDGLIQITADGDIVLTPTDGGKVDVGCGVTGQLSVDGNISMIATKTVDGVDVSDHDHSGAAGHGTAPLDIEAIPSTISLRNFEYDGIYWDTHFESIDGLDKDVSAGGAVALQSYRLQVTSGATAGNYGQAYDKQEVPLATFTWDKGRRIKTACKFNATDNLDAWLVCGYGGEWGDTSRHIGFKVIDGTLYGTVADGTTESTLNLGALAGNTRVVLEAVLTPGVECRFYVNGVDEGALTTNLPSGTTDADYMIFLQSKTSVDSSRALWVSEWRFLQEP